MSRRREVSGAETRVVSEERAREGQPESGRRRLLESCVRLSLARRPEGAGAGWGGQRRRRRRGSVTWRVASPVYAPLNAVAFSRPVSHRGARATMKFGAPSSSSSSDSDSPRPQPQRHVLFPCAQATSNSHPQANASCPHPQALTYNTVHAQTRPSRPPSETQGQTRPPRPSLLRLFLFRRRRRRFQ